jgi:hypothetical protein
VSGKISELRTPNSETPNTKQIRRTEKWEEGRKGGREEGRKGAREQGRKGAREEGRKGGRENGGRSGMLPW